MAETEPGAVRPPLSARALAARILERVIDEGAWSQKAIDGELRHFRGDFEAHVAHGKCPFPQSFEL